MRARRILLIDDEKGFTRLVRLNLERLGGYEVREENDAWQALPAAREFRPDLILLDVVMPELDGGDVASQLRADELTRDIPVVFLTCLVPREEPNLQGVMSAGNLFMPKPTDVNEVVKIIESRLGAWPPPEAAPAPEGCCVPEGDVPPEAAPSS